MYIKIGHSCFINYCRSDYQCCSYCGGKVGKKNYAYSIRKKTNTCSYNVWLHFKCLNPFYKDLTKAFENNQTMIVGELLAGK